ncbi:MAG TPA: hypothetical protein VLJ13_10640 [Brevundimonas sp.]|nr:hypothetical protein [Brevundimonas sp.]
MPKSRKPRRTAAAARTRRAPDAIDEAMRVFSGVIAAVTLAKAAQRLPLGSPRGLRMLERSVRMLDLLEATSAPPSVPAGPSAPSFPAEPTSSSPAAPAGPRP